MQQFCQLIFAIFFAFFAKSLIFVKVRALFILLFFLQDLIFFQKWFQILAGKAARHLCHLFRRALGHDFTACTAALGAQIDNMIGALDQIQIVLNDNDRVARIHQLLQHLDEEVDISHVEAGSRLVEDIHGLTRAAGASSLASFTR